MVTGTATTVTVAFAVTLPTLVIGSQLSARLSWSTVQSGAAFGSPINPGGSPTVRSFAWPAAEVHVEVEVAVGAGLAAGRSGLQAAERERLRGCRDGQHGCGGDQRGDDAPRNAPRASADVSP